MKTHLFYFLCAAIIVAVPGQFLQSQPASPFRLGIARTNSDVVLTWTNTGVLLQSASGLTGAWNVITGAISPHVLSPTNPVGFFRLQATNTSPSFAALYVAPTFSSSVGDPSGCGCVSPENPNSLGTVGGAQDNAMGTVLLQTGELTQDGVALEIPGRGINWRFEMRYRSGMSYSGPVGGSWDFNYNRRLVIQTNGNILCVNGLGRVDLYTHNPNGTFTSPAGFFTQLTTNAAGEWKESDRHGNTNLYLLPNSLGIAQLGSISDRNGNQMTFQYNGASELTNVVDTLGRSIAYGYDTNGRLTNVTDFAGRVLRFTYNTNGDLTSMTSPAVSGTPNGNDFPSGKTTLYTYSSGYADPRFNHELLTVTAPNEAAVSGPPRLIAQYNTDSFATDAARLTSLTLGGTNSSGTPAGGTISFAYMSFGYVSSTDYATPVFQNTVTDRNGNVTQYQFNQLGNVVSQEQFTRGIRAGDPAAYTSIFSYNADGLMTAITDAELSSVQYVYDSGNSNRLAQGNLLQTIWQPGPRSGDQPQIVWVKTYETNFNFLATSTDGRSNTMTFKYDSHGNRTNVVHRLSTIVDDYTYNSFGQMTSHTLPDNGQGHRRMDMMLYYNSGPQTGYLQRAIVDSGGFKLTNSYAYNAAGVVTNFIDARGSNTIYLVNSLNQVVLTSSRAVATTNGLVRYQVSYFYDANNNLIGTSTQNIDDGGNLVASQPSFTITNVYDILDEPLVTVQQVATNHFVTTACQYDANGNRTLSSSGVATSGVQTNNTVSAVYDERDLVYQKTLAPNDPNHSTTQYDYDGNRNLVSKSQGIESNPRITTYTYDGYDRRTNSSDAMGNVTVTHYDANGNVVSSELDGELVDVPGSAGNVRLSETAYTYDAENRRTVSDASFFDPVTQADIGGGHAITTVAYSANSQVLTNMDADTNFTVTLYDTANRLSMVTDSKSNTVTYIYDANNNVTRKIEVDLSDLGSPSQTISTTNSYDGMDRLIQKVDNLGNTTRYAYDSRNHRLTTTDGRGNMTRYAYDGLNRQTTTTRYLTSNGLGSGTPAGQIITSQSFDDNSRLTAQTDNNANTTTYVYDSLNRRIETVFADGTTNGAVYDVHHNPITLADANGNVVNMTYDLNNRAISRGITPGPGISGTTSETYQYDGLSRIVSATNDDSAVTRGYDSLSDVTVETQQVLPGGTAQNTSSDYDAMGNLLSCNYPGGTVINYAYDPLNRLQMVTNATGMIASYSYLGRDRVQRRDYGNGTRAAFTYDNDRRLTNSAHSIIFSGTNLDSRNYSWDAANNQTAMTDLLAAQNSRGFSYDSLGRLIQATNAYSDFTYTLDGVGNRITGYTLASGPDQAMNQYTTTPFDSRTYDANGNMTGAGSEQLFYDYRNQLVFCTNTTSGVALTFKYDCFGRRLEKSGANSTNRYCYVGWQEVEEQDGADATVATYVYGNGIDELLSMNRGGQSYFYHADDLGSIRKVTDQTGAIVEQYNYDDFGTPSFFDGSGTPLSGTQIGNAMLYTGRRYDAETGYYYYRTRYLDSLVGRFITRDPIGGWADRGNLGNNYSYVGNRPVSFVDPMGTTNGVPGVVQRDINPFGIFIFEDLPAGEQTLQIEEVEDPPLAPPGGNSSSGSWGNYHFEELPPDKPTLQIEVMDDPPLVLPDTGSNPPPDPGTGGSPPPDPGTGGSPPPDPGTGGSPAPDPGTGGSPAPDPGTGGSPAPDPGTGGSPAPDPDSDPGSDSSGGGGGGFDNDRITDAFGDPGSDSSGGGGGGGGMCCFVKDTLINTPEGTEPIQDIQIGDYVLSYNENTQVVEPRKVTKLIRSRRADLVQLKFGREVITCSCNHRFYTADRRWVPADELTGRDILMRFQRDNDNLAETSFEIKSTPRSHSVPIFNITVDGNHDYFVGKSAVLVHNSKVPSDFDKSISNFGGGPDDGDPWDNISVNPSGSKAGTSPQAGSKNVKVGQ